MIEYTQKQPTTFGISTADHGNLVTLHIFDIKDKTVCLYNELPLCLCLHIPFWWLTTVKSSVLREVSSVIIYKIPYSFVGHRIAQTSFYIPHSIRGNGP